MNYLTDRLGAIFSDDRKYRYLLWRSWGNDRKAVAFIGLNPSTADESIDDPTIRRCLGFASSWGFNTLYMLNLFAYRSTDPSKLLKTRDPVGHDNDQWLFDIYRKCSLVVAAWGTKGNLFERDIEVLKSFGNLKCLGHTKYGYPRHPLYVKKDTELEAVKVREKP